MDMQTEILLIIVAIVWYLIIFPEPRQPRNTYERLFKALSEKYPYMSAADIDKRVRTTLRLK